MQYAALPQAGGSFECFDDKISEISAETGTTFPRFRVAKPDCRNFWKVEYFICEVWPSRRHRPDTCVEMVGDDLVQASQLFVATLKHQERVNAQRKINAYPWNHEVYIVLRYAFEQRICGLSGHDHSPLPSASCLRFSSFTIGGPSSLNRSKLKFESLNPRLNIHFGLGACPILL